DFGTFQAQAVCIRARRIGKSPFSGRGLPRPDTRKLSRTDWKFCSGSTASSRFPHYLHGGREVSIMRIQHWQDAASLVLGVWLVVSPFVLGFGGAELWITVVLGVFVATAAVEGFVLPSYLEEWTEILFGAALVMVPWTVGYESVPATVNSVASGILV